MNQYFSLFNEQLAHGVTHDTKDKKKEALPVWKEVPAGGGGKPGASAPEKKQEEQVFQQPAVQTAAVAAADSSPDSPPSDPNLNQPGRGSMIVQVSMADRAVPLEGVKVTVKPSGSDTVISVMATDSSGRTPELELPAPPRGLSQVPNSKVPTFSTYDVKVEFPGYYPSLDKNVPVFDGIRSIQPVSLVPVPRGQNPNQEQVIVESEPTDL